MEGMSTQLIHVRDADMTEWGKAFASIVRGSEALLRLHREAWVQYTR
jgi:hypothetical protein